MSPPGTGCVTIGGRARPCPTHDALAELRDGNGITGFNADTQDEVTRILTNVTTFHNYVYLSTAYSCGLRSSEAHALMSAISMRKQCSCTEATATAQRIVPFRCLATPCRYSVAIGSHPNTRP